MFDKYKEAIQHAVAHPYSTHCGYILKIEGILSDLLETAQAMGYETDIGESLDNTEIDVWGWTEKTPKHDFDWIVTLCYPTTDKKLE